MEYGKKEVSEKLMKYLTTESMKFTVYKTKWVDSKNDFEDEKVRFTTLIDVLTFFESLDYVSQEELADTLLSNWQDTSDDGYTFNPYEKPDF